MSAPRIYDSGLICRLRQTGMFVPEIVLATGASRTTVVRTLRAAGIRVAPTYKERFWRKVAKTSSCWLWTGVRDAGGYGRVRIDRHNRMVHRVSYEWLVGPIPVGLTIDHLCRTTNCVNPAHLEAVTIRENVLRSSGITAQNLLKQVCINGHPFDEANTYRHPRLNHRRCRTCMREVDRNYRARKGSAA